MPKPTPDLESIKKTRVLKKKGLNNCEIGRVLKVHEKQVRRWLNYISDKRVDLSTV